VSGLNAAISPPIATKTIGLLTVYVFPYNLNTTLGD
jgi:hypothetical protein